MEVIGFWILFGGWMILLLSSLYTEKWMLWIEEVLKIPWYLQICTPVLGIITSMTGWCIWCLGNRGRYPGYPLDRIIGGHFW